MPLLLVLMGLLLVLLPVLLLWLVLFTLLMYMDDMLALSPTIYRRQDPYRMVGDQRLVKRLDLDLGYHKVKTQSLPEKLPTILRRGGFNSAVAGICYVYWLEQW